MAASSGFPWLSSCSGDCVCEAACSFIVTCSASCGDSLTPELQLMMNVQATMTEVVLRYIDFNAFRPDY